MFPVRKIFALLVGLWLLGAGAPVWARGPLVLAAASLQEGLNAAADDWARRGHARPVLSFASSAQLARQVVAGAPADLFIAADQEWMDHVAAAGRLRPGTRADFVSNRLVLVAPAGRPVQLRLAPRFALARALGAGRLAMGDPDTVPAGRYGKQALEALGVWPQAAPRLARAESVRAALALVARGETPLGIVYATDARAEPRVRVVAMFAATSHAPIRYPVAALTTSSSPEAEPFRRYLLSPAGRMIFAKFGFGAP